MLFYIQPSLMNALRIFIEDLIHMFMLLEAVEVMPAYLLQMFQDIDGYYLYKLSLDHAPIMTEEFTLS